MPKGIPKAGERVNRAAERRQRRPAQIDPNQFYSVEEAAAARDQSPATAIKDIESGALRSIKEGRRRKVLGAWIIEANQRQAAA